MAVISKEFFTKNKDLVQCYENRDLFFDYIVIGKYQTSDFFKILIFKPKSLVLVPNLK
jgi:hypothetical protein